LAGFPPDSGYLRSALETGWIGLFLSCAIFFTILYVGVRNYYLSKTKEVRGIYVGLVAALFAYVVANYAQVAIGQFPGSFFFYGAIAVIVKLRGIEREQLFNTNNIK
jgi:O-antigen ligase